MVCLFIRFDILVEDVVFMNFSLFREVNLISGRNFFCRYGVGICVVNF